MIEIDLKLSQVHQPPKNYLAVLVVFEGGDADYTEMVEYKVDGVNFTDRHHQEAQRKVNELLYTINQIRKALKKYRGVCDDELVAADFGQEIANCIDTWDIPHDNTTIDLYCIIDRIELIGYSESSDKYSQNMPFSDLDLIKLD